MLVTILMWLGALGSLASIGQFIYAGLSYHRGGAMPLKDDSAPRLPYIRMIFFAAITWAAVGFYYYDRHYSGPDPMHSVREDSGTVVVWGSADYREKQPHRLQLIADGGRILSHNPSFQSDYRLALVCFHTDKTRDHRDIDNLQKSALYDIGNGGVSLVLAVDDAFIKEWESGVRQTYYFLFLIPKGMEMNQFSTIRQAEALGAVQIAGRLGPP